MAGCLLYACNCSGWADDDSTPMLCQFTTHQLISLFFLFLLFEKYFFCFFWIWIIDHQPISMSSSLHHTPFLWMENQMHAPPSSRRSWHRGWHGTLPKWPACWGIEGSAWRWQLRCKVVPMAAFVASCDILISSTRWLVCLEPHSTTRSQWALSADWWLEVVLMHQLDGLQHFYGG